MKVFVTGVAGQLGHDVMNELAARGYEGIGTDIAPQYRPLHAGGWPTQRAGRSFPLIPRRSHQP